jgi:prevent-host-death family protein
MTNKPPHPKVSFLLARSHEIPASQFKARCLEIMDQVQRSGIEVTITKHRKPVARLVPVTDASSSFCGFLKGRVLWMGDVVSPIDEEWTCDEQNMLAGPRKRRR